MNNCRHRRRRKAAQGAFFTFFAFERWNLSPRPPAPLRRLRSLLSSSHYCIRFSDTYLPNLSPRPGLPRSRFRPLAFQSFSLFPAAASLYGAAFDARLDSPAQHSAARQPQTPGGRKGVKLCTLQYNRVDVESPLVRGMLHLSSTGTSIPAHQLPFVTSVTSCSIRFVVTVFRIRIAQPRACQVPLLANHKPQTPNPKLRQSAYGCAATYAAIFGSSHATATPPLCAATKF